MSGAERRRRGARIASLLAGSWRADPPAPEAAPDLDVLAPLLHRGGSAALAWSRLRGVTPAPAEAVEGLHSGPQPAGGLHSGPQPAGGLHSGPQPAGGLRQAHRMQALRASLHRRHVAHVVEVFRAHGVDPVLVKGWAAARLYPSEGLRPTGDVDLCVRPREEADARRALAAVTEDCSVDLHVGFAFLDDRSAAEVERRCETVPIEGAHVRVLGCEDHLRLLSVHMLGHGAWRPVWLADVAVALETRPAGFDWEWFHAGSRRRSDWADTCLRLAHRLLGAALDGVPAAVGTGPVPRWVPDAVLEAWGDDRRESQGARLPMRHLRGPGAVLRGLRRRWPDPLEATVGVGAPMGTFPRWPLQVAECVRRTARFVLTVARPPHPVASRAAALALTGARRHG